VHCPNNICYNCGLPGHQAKHCVHYGYGFGRGDVRGYGMGGFAYPGAHDPRVPYSRDEAPPGEPLPMESPAMGMGRGRPPFPYPSFMARGCYNCGDYGHQARECPKKKICYKCNQEGHMAKDCGPCYSCGQPGHHARDCPQRDSVAEGQLPPPMMETNAPPSVMPPVGRTW